jgi:hypothetical protein
VVLNDPWQPWWFASIDGQPAEILRANVLFRAVAVPPGRHIVRFEFRPLAGAWKELAGHAWQPVAPPAPAAVRGTARGASGRADRQG